MSEQREKQLILVYSVVAVIVLYYAITHWLPYLQRALGLYLEKSEVLQSVEHEVANDNFDIKELAEYKSRAEKLKEDAPKKMRIISPGFVLEHREGAPINEPKEKQDNDVNGSTKRKVSQSISPGYQLPTHSPTVPGAVSSNTGAGNTSASTRSSAARINATATVEEQLSNPPPRYLASFAPGSIEAQVHAEMGRRADLFGIQHLQFDPYQLQREAEAEEARMAQERALREEQDVAYQQSLQQDQSAQFEAEQKQRLEEQVISRRHVLSQLLKSEPETSIDSCITLQFRSRHTSMRIKRRFLSSEHTAQNLLDFVESLELRPLLSTASASCVLTLDFPTRTVSRATESDKTLADLGISADSVVWIKFEDE